MRSDERYANIPQELKERLQWVCYRNEKRGAEKTKVPYRPGGGRAKTNDPATWDTFENALKAASLSSNMFDGIAFMLAESDPYVFIDLDHVVNDDGIEESAQKIIQMVGSYAELSQSKTGIHILARAKKPGSSCRVNSIPWFEIYERERMVVFTGNILPGSKAEITDAQTAVEDIYYDIFGTNSRATLNKVIPLDTRHTDMSHAALIDKAMSAANGDKFCRLWNGITQDYNGDDSAADLALCCMLAFWTGRDAARMDRLFRESGLMRDKWDQKRGEMTYGEMTIEEAIAKNADVYTAAAVEQGKTEDELTAARERIRRAKEVGSADAVHHVADALALLPQGEYQDTVAELKRTVSHLDLRTLQGVVSKARRSKRAGKRGDYPELVINNRQLRDLGNETVDQLARCNVPPKLFSHSGRICQVVNNDCGHPVIRFVTEKIMLSLLAKTFDVVSVTQDGKKNVDPPKNLITYILSEENWPFPPLEGIIQCPMVRQDGSIIQHSGYDAKTRLFYDKPGDEVIDVPENPSEAQMKAAVCTIEELLCDFPFDCQASKVNAIAMLLSLVLKPAIGDVMPLFLIDATTAGSGKSLLASIAGIISCGNVPAFTTAPTRDDDWQKKITSLLSDGQPIVVFDNVDDVIKAASLAALLTARKLKDRVFGTNTETINLLNNTLWVLTGNNIQLGGDILRRCASIRMDPKHAKPHERECFQHQNLKQWAIDNRARLLNALLTLCRAWHAHGQPMYSTPAFGSFETWARIVGSILAHAGIQGFLANRNALWEQTDVESGEWESFLEKCREVYGTKQFNLTQLIGDIEHGVIARDNVPVAILDAIGRAEDKHSKLGYILKARSGKRYDSLGLRLEKGSRTAAGNRWRVLADDIPPGCTVAIETTNECVSDVDARSRVDEGREGIGMPKARSQQPTSGLQEKTDCKSSLAINTPAQTCLWTEERISGSLEMGIVDEDELDRRGITAC